MPVHLEVFDDIQAARAPEGELKRWRRSWKCALVDAHNPAWADLAGLL